MTQSRLLLFARDPGAANAIIPVYNRLKKQSAYSVTLTGKEFALRSYKKEGLSGEDVGGFIIDKKTASDYLSNNNFDLVLTGVHSDDFTDRNLWRAAKDLGIPTIAILDQWINYRGRFTMDKPGHDASQSKLVVPDYVCTMDEMTKAALESEAVSGTRVVVTGQPYFETIRNRIQSLTEAKLVEIHKQLGLRDKSFVITFASEPIVESYEDPFYLGYTEFTILDVLLANLDQLAYDLDKQIDVVVKLHPRNHSDLFTKYQNFGNNNLKIIVNQTAVSQELIAVSDAVLGMSSMFLLEAVIAEKPILSIQLNLKRKDPFILSRLDQVETITNERDLIVMLKKMLTEGEVALTDLALVDNATDNIVEVIANALNNVD